MLKFQKRFIKWQRTPSVKRIFYEIRTTFRSHLCHVTTYRGYIERERGERERGGRERGGYFTSNCEQKNISHAQLLTFLMLLALYPIKFLISGRRGPWFLIQHDDDDDDDDDDEDDGARTQNYWKYLIKKVPHICPVTVQVTKKDA